MVDYNRLAIRVQKLLAKYGKTVTIVRYVEGEAPDPETPWRKGATEEIRVVTRGVFDDYPVDKLQSDAFQPGDRKLYIPAVGQTFVPHKGDIVEVNNGEIWGIEEAVAVEPADVAVLWQAQVRLWPTRAPSQ